MSDIVERLRLHGDKFPIKDSAEWIDFASLYLVEAADEIERLRAALVEAIEFADQDYMVLTPTGEAMVARWRAALGGSDE